MKEHNFILNGCDTDSIMVNKPDGSEFTEQEQHDLLEELNSLFPELINFAPDGYFRKTIVFKAKNYVMLDSDGEITYKGSALKSGGKETALRDFIKDIISSILYDKNDYVEVYHRYIKEALNVQDIKRWSSRKTLSQTTMTSERANETKIVDAIEDTEYKEGDRVWLFFKEDGTLELCENFTGEYDKMALVKKLYNTAKLFWPVLGKEVFINYSLKKNKELLNAI